MKCTRRVLLAIVLVCGTTACVTSEVPDTEYSDYKYCGYKPHSNEYILTDSTATCGNGTPANLVSTRWVSTNGSCTVNSEKDILGGMAHVKRDFGCYDIQWE